MTREPNPHIETTLDVLERHIYGKITDCIDHMALDEAGKIVEIAKAVGLI